MKVLTLSFSNNGVAEDMQLLLDSFISGMKESGAEIEAIDLNKLNIQPCEACTDRIDYESCGKCKCDDDMQLLYPKLRDSDVWIFADSVANSLSKTMRNVLDRMEPLFQPDSSNLENIPVIDRNKKIAFLSVSKYFEMKQFTDAVNHFKSLSKVYNRIFAGALLRPHSWALTKFDKIGIKTNDVIDAAKEAGRQIILNGRIPTVLQKTVSRQLIPKNSMLNNLAKML